MTSKDADALNRAFQAVRVYDWGHDPSALKAIDDAVHASHTDAAARKDLEKRLSVVLKTDASRAAKSFVCRRLSRIGGVDSVPALKSLLMDQKLSHLARYALERMTCPQAARALRDALPRVNGELEVGVINSLGVRRDVQSSPLLTSLLDDADAGVAGAAAAALGRIGTSEAAVALQSFQSRAPEELRLIAADACLACAERLLAAGEKSRASAMYKALCSPQQPRHVRLAAARGLAATARRTVSPKERRQIEAALPEKALVPPARPRKLLIFDLNVGYPGHSSIASANLALALMGTKTGAFDATVSRDPEIFRPANLRRFDAVFFNNTVGNLFTDAELRQSLIDFVHGGGGLLGVHGTTVAFTKWPGAHEDWPEFGILLGARGANHRDSKEHVFIKLDDDTHPLNRPFDTEGFDFRDEFFRVHGPYSRDRVRVLLSIDCEKTDLDQGRERGRCVRADGDYALAWVRSYGRGRVFYSTIGHNPYVFSDARMLKFYLGAVQFALGDLPAPTLPSARLTPAARAQEKLGWRLGVTAYSFHKYTFFEAIQKTAQLGLSYIGGLSFQKVSDAMPENFAPGLTDDQLRQVRLKLDSTGVRLLTYYIHRIPGDEAGCRRVFEFGRKMGIETFISEPSPDALDTIERFCDDYDIHLALHNHDKKASPHYWHPEEILKICRGRSRHIGACGDLGYWMRSGIDPIEALSLLKGRLITVQMHDLHEHGDQGHDVPWGSGVGKTKEFLETMHRLGVQPTMFGLEYSYDWLDSMPEMAACIEFFNRRSLKLAQ